MPLAQRWREELHDHRWSVAQINASFDESVEAMRAIGGIRNGGSEAGEHCFELNSEEAYELFVAYGHAGSTWTFLESVQGCLDVAKLMSLSKRLETDLLAAAFEDNLGYATWICYQKGTIVAAADTGGPEFFDPRSDCYDNRTHDGEERIWITNSSFSLRLFGELLPDFDIETATFEDSWKAIGDILDTDHPTTCALNDPENGIENSVLLELA